MTGVFLRGEKTRIEGSQVHHRTIGVYIRSSAILEDNYIHSLINMESSLGESIRFSNRDITSVQHNTAILSLDSYALQNVESTAKTSIAYNYLVGRLLFEGGLFELTYNRFGRETSRFVIGSAGITTSIDNRYADNGDPIDGNFGDLHGDGTGTGDAWGTGYLPKYALPGN